MYFVGCSYLFRILYDKTTYFQQNTGYLPKKSIFSDHLSVFFNFSIPPVYVAWRRSVLQFFSDVLRYAVSLSVIYPYQSFPALVSNICSTWGDSFRFRPAETVLPW